jgi:hypothetical protein
MQLVADPQDDQASQDALKCRRIDTERTRKFSRACFALLQFIGDAELGSHIEDLRRLGSECSAKQRLGRHVRIAAGIHTFELRIAGSGEA